MFPPPIMRKKNGDLHWQALLRWWQGACCKSITSRSSSKELRIRVPTFLRSMFIGKLPKNVKGHYWEPSLCLVPWESVPLAWRASIDRCLFKESRGLGLYTPSTGGGSIFVEAARLGLKLSRNTKGLTSSWRVPYFKTHPRLGKRKPFNRPFRPLASHMPTVASAWI